MEATKTIKLEREIRVKEEDILIIKMLGESMTAREIAEATGINIRTVEAKIAALRKKYGVAGNVGLVMLFYRNKLID